MKKTLMAALGVALILTTSCTTSNQFYGTMTGASVGGLFGSAIGGITGGPRGHDAGTIIGMAVGGAIGAAATAPKTSAEKRSSDYGEYSEYGYDGYYSPYADLEISNLRLVESTRDNCINAGEHAKLVFEIRNTGRDYIYDIAPVITVEGTKQIYLSPTAIVSELAPGRAVRYTSEVVATSKLKSGTARFAIGFSDGDRLYTASTFDLATRGR